ncbi:hypothetical protein EVAR_74213_1 [Eumeta japonica]|uniref:Uncharacterized protein n=1 Tax=Eumeta variegata TaxID=151549 RepID=A0A4C1SD79_EUMVA|nr:hypothetical protein EVAR_74213_1 [Eumeta japonica]
MMKKNVIKKLYGRPVAGWAVHRSGVNMRATRSDSTGVEQIKGYTLRVCGSRAKQNGYTFRLYRSGANKRATRSDSTGMEQIRKLQIPTLREWSK